MALQIYSITHIQILESTVPPGTCAKLLVPVLDEKSMELAKSLYSCFVKGNFYLTNTLTAEFVKLMENTFRDINMPNHILQIVKRLVDNIKDPVITVFGVAYNGGVDDTRETPALKFIKLAENEGYKVKVHDPYVKEFEYEILGLEESVRASDCVVLITDHPEFKEIEPYRRICIIRMLWIRGRCWMPNAGKKHDLR
jgi:UDP-N-acetyl-D-mannosaminuronate dehydrogenase